MTVPDIKVSEFMPGGKAYGPGFFGIFGQWVVLKPVQGTREEGRLTAGIFQVQINLISHDFMRMRHATPKNP